MQEFRLFELLICYALTSISIRLHCLYDRTSDFWKDLLNIFTCIVTIDGGGLVSRFIDHLQVVTTNKYYIIADFHTTHHSTLSLLSLFPLVFTW
jgi:hypothetical protein